MRFWILILSTWMSTLLPTEAQIVDKKMQSGFYSPKKRNIEAIIVHSVFNNSGGDQYNVDLIIRQFERYRVSTHYLIDRCGKVYRLVDEKKVAYHAGRSVLPDGRTHVNNLSLGIELICSFADSTTTAQINSLIMLTRDIKQRYPIKYVLRHADIAPGRKKDPWNLNWEAFKSGL